MKAMAIDIVSLVSDWQNAVIGLMIFAASFGVLASVLSICGVCTTPLPRKIYYFHSAGEIFLICGELFTTFTLREKYF
jgi:hypothetical protein